MKILSFDDVKKSVMLTLMSEKHRVPMVMGDRGCGKTAMAKEIAEDMGAHLVVIDANVLTEDEIDIYKRARNTKVNSHPSSTDIITYKMATGLEALFGYLYLNNKLERIKELINIIMEV